MKKVLILLLLVYSTACSQTVQIRGSLIPNLPDTYDIGSSTELFRDGWLSEMNAVLFAKNTITLLGGDFYVTKNAGTLQNNVTNITHSVDFGTAMTNGDIIVFRNAGQVEYMEVIGLISGTMYNVTRNLDSSGANIWVMGTPWACFGHNGDARIEFAAPSSEYGPRISMIAQGNTYNVQTEHLRIGNLNGMPTYTSNTLGFYIGDATNYLKFDTTSKTLTIAGNINILGGNAATTTYTDSVGGAAKSYADGQASSAQGNAEGYAERLIPNTIKAPSGSGLFLSSGHMGFYTSSTWKSYFDSVGDMVLGNITTGGNGLSWNQSTGTFTIQGSQVITEPSGKRITINYGNDNELNFYDVGVTDPIVKIGDYVYGSLSGMKIGGGMIYMTTNSPFGISATVTGVDAEGATAGIFILAGGIGEETYGGDFNAVGTGLYNYALIASASGGGTNKAVSATASGSGANCGYVANAYGGSSNYSFYGVAGDIYNNGNITATGTVNGSNLAISNWNTAYGWGNWSSNFGTASGKICQGNDSRLSNSRTASDVYAWAKASTKPSYNYSDLGSTPTNLAGYGITDANFGSQSNVELYVSQTLGGLATYKLKIIWVTLGVGQTYGLLKTQ